jgi:hypothetical protein
VVRAILKNGVIQPIDPLPPEWQDGMELEVDAPPVGRDPGSIERWYQEWQDLKAQIPPEDHEIMARSIAEQKRVGQVPDPAAIDEWDRQVESAACDIPPQDHATVQQAVEQHRQEQHDSR